MAKPVTHSPYCAWRRGGECSCGGNRNAGKPKELTLCLVCCNEPCDCDKYDERPQDGGPG